LQHVIQEVRIVALPGGVRDLALEGEVRDLAAKRGEVRDLAAHYVGSEACCAARGSE
jgi:hypothetical protein